jgi:glycosyltransferase involved in cell wall biosynthesis
MSRTEEQMHVIQTISGIAESAGGPSRVVASLCSAVAARGCGVELVAGHEGALDGALVAPSSRQVKLHLVEAKRVAGVRIHPGFGRAVQQLAQAQSGVPSLVHDHGIWGLTNIAAANAARRAGVPYVLHTHGMLEPWALRFKAHKKRLAWAAYQRRIVGGAAALVTTSDQERDSVKRLFPRHPVAVIPNGVDLPETSPNRASRSPTDRANVLFMSRVHPVKNLLGLVQAWSAVCLTPSRKRWMLQIAGPDELDHTREVMALVRSLGLESRVEFLGPVGEDNKHKLLEAADVFVLPSFSENFGIVVAEALAHGLPTIASKGTPWSGLVQHGCGWWADPTPDSLAQALAKAVDLSNAERHCMGLRGRDFARDAFSWDGIGSSTVLLYEWIIGRTSVVPPFVYV